ncbi:MAG: LptA/OstA family protein [Hyphomonas sp.]|uniref:LptA/OstA family protein n=1 Tax=Hyphomonas sp. TaxID=87 RepID=UPI003527AF33
MAPTKVFGALAALAFLAAPAFAQISSEGGPIYINSDRTESLERERKVLLIGNVDIQQGTARLRANQVTLVFAGKQGGNGPSGLGGSFGQIQSMIAEGEVFYVTPELKAKGNRGVYEAAADTITMTGEVALMRGRDVAEGETLKLEIGNRRTTLDGGTGRTRMMIDPDAQGGETN